MTKKDFQIQVGRRIRELRMKKGFSQMELAYRCNFEKSNMNRIESGNTNITTYNLFIITSELEISLEHFFAGMKIKDLE